MFHILQGPLKELAGIAAIFKTVSHCLSGSSSVLHERGSGNAISPYRVDISLHLLLLLRFLPVSGSPQDQLHGDLESLWDAGWDGRQGSCQKNWTEAQRMILIFFLFKLLLPRVFPYFLFKLLLLLLIYWSIYLWFSNFCTLQVSVRLANVNSELLIHCFETELWIGVSVRISVHYLHWHTLVFGLKLFSDCSASHIFKIPWIMISFNLWGMWEICYKPLTQLWQPRMSEFTTCLGL